MAAMKPEIFPRHRAEIDGLRSLAILPVLLFHFSIPGFSGGFVGVDIFFVISGFLIGGILWSEFSRTNRIRLGHFFMRRIRRLAPAYFAMTIVSLAFAWFILLPFEFREFGKELIASTVYLSNVHFFREAGYFDGLADQKILLHTWSLSVEEQFYIFLPFFMLLFSRVRKALPPVLIGVLVVSLIACILLTPVSQTATFYLFPFRAWELLAGVCLAIAGQKYKLSWSFNAGLSWAGLVLILGSVTLIPEGDAFPGFFALLPVCGAVLMIANGQQDNIVNRSLSHRIPVFIGLISYSLYLWHWPIMTLSKYYADTEPGLVTNILFITLSIGVAWLSWRFVEMPVRRGTVGLPGVLGGTIAASALTLGAGGVIFFNDGLIDRFPENISTHIQATADFNQDWHRCTTPSQGAFAGIEICPIGPEGPPKLLIWGDSHVRAFKEGLEQAAYEADVPAVIIWTAGCPPLLGLAKEENTSTQIQNETCALKNLQIEKAFDTPDGPETLLLIGRWSYYAEGRGIGTDIDNTIRLFPANKSPVSGSSQPAILASAWENSADILIRHFENIFILRQVPEIANYSSRDISRKLAHGHLSDPVQIADIMSVSRANAEARAAGGDAAMQHAAHYSKIRIIDGWSEFCTDSTCSAMHDETAGYFDNNHITNRTAKRVRNLFDPVFSAAGGSLASR